MLPPLESFSFLIAVMVLAVVGITLYANRVDMEKDE